MTFLPLALRELQVASRDRRLYLARAIGPGLMSIFLLWIIAQYGELIGKSLPANFAFRLLAYMAFGIVLFDGAMRTSDLIAREKREETLGLLFLTSLTGWDVVLGKLLSAGLRTLAGLAGTIPILTIAIMLGGVTGADVWQTSITLIVTAFFSLALGLAISSICVAQAHAHGFAAFSLIFFAAGIPWFADWVQVDLEMDTLSRIIQLFSPVWTANTAMGAFRRFDPEWFWAAIAIQFVLACGFLAFAAKLSESSWKIKGQSSSAARLRERWAVWARGNPVEQTGYRTALLDNNPWFWLSSRDRLGPFLNPFFLVIAICSSFLAASFYEMEGEDVIGVLCIGWFFMDLFFRVRMAAQSAQQLGSNRLSGGLELVLGTKMSPADIVQGQTTALRRNYNFSRAVHLIGWLVVLALLANQDVDNSFIQRGLLAGLSVYILTCLATFAVLPSISMWKALRMTNPNHAPGMSLIITSVLPWFIFGMLLTTLRKLQWSWWYQTTPEFVGFLALAIWLGSVIPFYVAARRGLRRNFRSAVSDRERLLQPIKMSQFFSH